jgi:error-prone DNA polymerase
VLVPDQADEICALRLRRLREAFGDRAYLALTLRRRPNDQLRLHELSNLAAQMRVPTVVTNDVLFHEPGGASCRMSSPASATTSPSTSSASARTPCRPLSQAAGGDAPAVRRYPEALARTLEIAERCRFSLDELAYQYPEEKLDIRG